MNKSDWSRFFNIVVSMVAVLVVVVVYGLLLVFPVMWCWNYVIPHISNGVVPEIGTLHAFALLLLSRFVLHGTSSTTSEE